MFFLYFIFKIARCSLKCILMIPDRTRTFSNFFVRALFKHMYSALDKYIYFQSNDPPLDRGEVSDTTDLQIPRMLCPLLVLYNRIYSIIGFQSIPDTVCNYITRPSYETLSPHFLAYILIFYGIIVYYYICLTDQRTLNISLNSTWYGNGKVHARRNSN